MNRLLSIIYEICYIAGLIVIVPVWLIMRAPKYLVRSLKGSPKQARHFLLRDWWKLQNRLKKVSVLLQQQTQLRYTLATFLVLIVISVTFLQGLSLVAWGQRFKGQVLGTADYGLSYLNGAQNSLQEQDITTASRQLNLALQSFQQSQRDLNSTNIAVKGLLNLVPQKQDAERLLEASTLLTEAGLEWAEFYHKSQPIKITAEGLSGVSASGLEELNSRMQTGKNKANQALSLINQVNPNNIPGDKRETFIAAKNLLQAVQPSLNTLAEMVDLTYQLIAGNKNVLLLFQNYNELRASGGFMGTFGAMKLSNGQIAELKISSIYDLDGQLQEEFTVPQPLLAVNNRLYLRDTNWFAHFPDSARLITKFYEKEGGETPDVIIALTPELIVDVLKITGPITLPRYNVSFTAENFVEQTQVESSVNYDKTLNQPKQVLADFFPTLLQSLSTLKGEQLLPLIQALQENLLQKHILLYAQDSQLQTRLDKFNWTGSLKPTDRDYLQITNTNLAGTKTDTYVDQSVTLESSIKDEKIINILTITRTNKLANIDSFLNKSFLRVYVPEKAQLISAQGFTSVDLPQIKDNQKIDPDIAEWERNLKIDHSSGTLVGKEAGKTFFGNWLIVRGGESKTVTLTYELPYSLEDIDHYSLLVQKQPGLLKQTFNYRLNFPGREVEWTTNQAQSLRNQELKLEQQLDKDYFYGIILRKP
jgi:hypothetical protein